MAHDVNQLRHARVEHHRVTLPMLDHVAMNMEIRHATATDAENIAALGISVWVDTYATEGLRTPLAKYALGYFALPNIRDLLASKTILVAELAEHIVGYAVLLCGPQSTEIHNLYVLANFQRRGIGKKLVEHITCKYPQPWLSCWDQNINAIRFYEALGFTAEGESCFELDGEKYRNITFSYIASEKTHPDLTCPRSHK